MRNYLIIAYACEDTGSEPGVGYHWSKTISNLNKPQETIIITRKNNNVKKLTENNDVKILGIDLPSRLLFVKKLIGTRLYYLLWTFLVFFHLLKNFKRYRTHIIHHITFTPIYYPPLYFVLPFKFNWGPVGGGENFPISYLKCMKLKDIIGEIFRRGLKNSIYINPLFYLGCYRAENIICSTVETSGLIPYMFKHKISIELMVMDSSKSEMECLPEKTIIIANRLIDWKMTHLFVAAFSDYSKSTDNGYKLIIIGDGPYLYKIAPYLNDKNIFHYKRFEKRSDMLNILKKASLFVSMSLRDSGAASLLEAISYHIPFLVTNSGAHRTFLETGAGFGFNLKNYQADKKKIFNLISMILIDDNILIEEKKKVKKLYTSFCTKEEKKKRIKNIIFEVN